MSYVSGSSTKPQNEGYCANKSAVMSVRMGVQHAWTTLVVPQFMTAMVQGHKVSHGSLNVPIFHITQPLDSIRYMVYNGYYKVMSNIPKMGHLTTPDHGDMVYH